MGLICEAKLCNGEIGCEVCDPLLCNGRIPDLNRDKDRSKREKIVELCDALLCNI